MNRIGPHSRNLELLHEALTNDFAPLNTKEDVIAAIRKIYNCHYVTSLRYYKKYTEAYDLSYPAEREMSLFANILHRTFPELKTNTPVYHAAYQKLRTKPESITWTKEQWHDWRQRYESKKRRKKGSVKYVPKRHYKQRQKTHTPTPVEIIEVAPIDLVRESLQEIDFV